ncbi:Pleckstrin domain-containing protein, partial [Globisporangium splendens]
MDLARSNTANMGTCSIRVIDLDDASTRVISWDPNVPDQVFESLIESQLRAAFGVSDEAWVDLIDTYNSSIVNITKDVLANVQHTLCLCLSPKTEALAPMKRSEVFEVMFTDRALGMTIREHNDSVIVNQFKRTPSGAYGAAEASGKIQIDDVIYKVQGARTVGRSYDTVVQMLQTQTRPLAIQFFRPFERNGLFAVEFRGTSLNMTITTDDVNVIVKDLPMAHPNIVGYAEAHGVRQFDIIHAVDGEIIRGLEYNRAIALLSRPTRPMVVVFARSKMSPQTPSRSTGVMTSRFSFASTVAPSPRGSRRGSTSSALSGGDGESMLVEEMLEFCEGFATDGTLTVKEVDGLREMVLSMRADVCSAIKRKNRNAVVAIVRSPTMRIWDNLLKTRESILLAGPVTLKRKKRYHLLLTDHERLLLVNRDTNLLEDEIMCSQIVTVSSRTKFQELLISTPKAEYVLVDNFISPVIWVRAILPFTCTQGMLKVASSRRFIGSKKRYFVLQGTRLTGYKKESMVHQVGAKSSSIMLTDATIESDPKALTFAINAPEFQQSGKKLILTAPSSREFNKWITALNALTRGAPPSA